MLWGNPPKWPDSHSQTGNRSEEEEQYQAEWGVISTLINDSKLPLNNLTLKTERGLARRVPVWVLKGPLGCLEYKECMRISEQRRFLFKVAELFSNNLFVLQQLWNWSWGWLIFPTSWLRMMDSWMRIFSDTAKTHEWTLKNMYIYNPSFLSPEDITGQWNIRPTGSEACVSILMTDPTGGICLSSLECKCVGLNADFLSSVGLRLKESNFSVCVVIVLFKRLEGVLSVWLCWNIWHLSKLN